MSRPLRILIVEDSEFHATLLLDKLRHGGYDPVFERVETAEAMRDALTRRDWDLVISDYVLPSFSAPLGLALLKETGLDLPFIIVSGSIGEDTAVETMKAGAHDYISKSNLARLVPAIQRELREAEGRRRRRQAEQALRDSERYLRAVMDNISVGIVTFGEQGVVESFNRMAEHMFGYDASQVIGQHFRMLLAEPLAADYEASFAQFVRTGKCATFSSWPHETKGHRKDGATFPIEVTINAVNLDPGRLFIASVRDVIARKQVEEMMEHQTLHDALTGLPNRTLLQDRLYHAMATGQREHRSLALLIMDLDRFKDVNETFGHQWGDLLLLEVGHRLRGALRETDTVARLGGDEFAILLPGADSRSAILDATKLLQALEQPFVLEEQSIDVRGSIGIALCPEHGEDAETLLRRADVAMYVAKRAHSGYATYAFEQDQHSPGRLALVGELRQAIEQDHLVLYYQPKVEFGSGRITSVEALVRWQHPQRGLIPPDQFIPLAEQTGLIESLSQWVLNAALRQCSLWQQAGVRLGVSVNLSARNLHDTGLPDTVAGLLETWNVGSEWLRLEITESAVMADPAQAMEVLARLDGMGVRIAIDDFGTGYSSLAYLKRLPVDELKIDKSFVLHMPTDEDDLAIVRSTIGLSHDLGLRVVAEGVENQATWDLLATFGCDFAQGYHLSRPLPAAELAHWLSSTLQQRNSTAVAAAC